MDRYRVLFLCTGNSARSIMAEALLTYWGGDRFDAYSAGSQPAGEVHPLALRVLESHYIPTTGLRSKSWDEFATRSAPRLHFVFTLCDRVAQELCPVWPGQPMTAHWGTPDPAAAVGSADKRERAFVRAFRELSARIQIFTSLRVDALEKLALKRELEMIGKMHPNVVDTDH
jgi:arsenate reductase